MPPKRAEIVASNFAVGKATLIEQVVGWALADQVLNTLRKEIFTMRLHLVSWRERMPKSTWEGNVA